MIFNAGIHGFREGGIELNARGAVGELAGTGILEPVIRRLHGIERDFSRAAVHRDCIGNVAVTNQIAAGVNCATVAAAAESPEDQRSGRGIVLRIECGMLPVVLEDASIALVSGPKYAVVRAPRGVAPYAGIAEVSPPHARSRG